MIPKTVLDTTFVTSANTNNKLILTQGLPRSGKSTWAREQGFPVVSPDAIRLATFGRRWWGPGEHIVWATAKTMVRALFMAGHEKVILDSTALLRKNRDFFKHNVALYYRRYVKVIDTPMEVCKERARKSHPELVDVIQRMSDTDEAIEPSEFIFPYA